MEKPLVVCCIQAFDCEKTIEAAMESIRNQSYENWLCFVLSNGNKNSAEAPNWSFDVIRNCAARDRRFIVVNKRENDMHMYFWMLGHLVVSFPDAYICTLDADDEYDSNFFERGVAFAEEKELDIVACGTEIIRKKRAGETEGTLLSRRQVEEDLVVRKDAFAKMFPTYKPFFNEMWGKLYRARLLRRKNYRQYMQERLVGRFLADTLLTIDCLDLSRSIGILSGTCHRFYQYEQRMSTNATLIANAVVASSQERSRKRSKFSVYSTHEQIMTFLRKHGEVDEALNEYMQAVLFGWFNDYYNRTLLPIQNEKSFVFLAARLIDHPQFIELMTYRDSGKYQNLAGYRQRLVFCRHLRNALVAQQMVRNREGLRRKGLPCTPAVQRQLAELIGKLDETARRIIRLQKEGTS